MKNKDFSFLKNFLNINEPSQNYKEYLKEL